MPVTALEMPSVKRIVAATDRSPSADAAARWGAAMAANYQAEFILLQVLVPTILDGVEQPTDDNARSRAEAELECLAHEMAGPRGRARVVVGINVADAILEVIEQEQSDVIVVGNMGMGGRKQFLLKNIPNRITHNAHCSVIVVNTQLKGGTGTPGTGRSAGAEVEVTEVRLLRRAFRIGRVLVKGGVRGLLENLPSEDDGTLRVRARRLCAALEELGPTFAKLGQALSTRSDLLPPPFIEELAHLQERVVPLSEAEVVSVMEQELRVPWEDVFASIDPQPLAAGTIAQVHRATLETGEYVVVKVQRPNAERDIEEDLALLERFAERTARRPAFRRVLDVPEFVRHLSNSLRCELDFRQEAGNLERLRALLTPYSRLAVPKVYEEFSTARVLVMEEVQGVPVQQVPPGRARTEAARQLLEAYYHQTVIEGFFHADPHPGNMKWWNDKIYLLDLGMVGHVEPEVRELLLLMLLAISQRDAKFFSEVVLMLAGQEQNVADVDTAGFEAELHQLIERQRSVSLKETRLGPLFQEIADISMRHDVRLPASLSLAAKAFAQMQLAVAELDPTLDAFAVISSFAVRSTVKRLVGGVNPRNVLYQFQKATVRLAKLLEAVEGLTGARPGPRLQVDFRGTERLERAIRQACRRTILALGVSVAVIGAVLAANSPIVPGWSGVVLSIAGIGLGGILVADLLVPFD